MDNVLSQKIESHKNGFNQRKVVVKQVESLMNKSNDSDIWQIVNLIWNGQIKGITFTDTVQK